jgi:hypothetical protein
MLVKQIKHKFSLEDFPLEFQSYILKKRYICRNYIFDVKLQFHIQSHSLSPLGNMEET